MTARAEALAASGLTIAAGGERLVGPVDFACAPGRPLTIIGETGAGKSLLAQAVMGSLPNGLRAEGEIRLGDLRLDRMTRRQRQRLWGRRLAILPQEPWLALDPLMRSDAQVAESHVFLDGAEWRPARERARDALSELGLSRRAADALPGALSGGMAQRVAFAAATAGGASTLLADEPTKGLDAARRDDVVRLLKRFVAAGGVLVAITHDIAVARALGGEALILKDGDVVERGPTERVLTAPESAYGRALVAADPCNWPKPTGGAPAGEPALKAERIAISRGGRRLISGLDFELQQGGRLAITGPSGLGKSSLLDVVAGLLPPAAGAIRRSGAAEAPFAIQKLYQDPPAAFAPRCALRESLGDLERRHGLPPERLPRLMERLGLAPALLDRRPNAVSGGELQRLALARVLALRPAAILADEPTSRLDLVTQRQVMEVIAETAAEAGAAVMLVTHDAAIAERWADATLDLSGCAETETTIVA